MAITFSHRCPNISALWLVWLRGELKKAWTWIIGLLGLLIVDVAEIAVRPDRSGALAVLVIPESSES